ncbi:MAG: PP2C family protein-serine/threonine phosphatase [Planctomycetota bacterium]|nr:PP2C family protein-serine/threonine phosphatase [Planctomycetota bacterium]
MPGSITGTPTFYARQLRAERLRILLLLASLGVILISACVRRALGGVVMAVDTVFYSSIAIILVASAISAFALVDTNRRISTGKPLPLWRSVLRQGVDLSIPFGLLTVLHFYSPLGSISALSAPVLLVVPLVIMLSVLRLKPAFCLGMGLAAAILHWMLLADTLLKEEHPPHVLPNLGTYGLLLALTGAAAAVIAAVIRRYIIEAVAEAQAAEQAAHSLSQIERELDIARDIQQGLLPSTPPTLRGFDIAGMARPAAQAGGDYYDWQTLSDGRLVVAIADVTGHGIGPALVMAVCRAYSRATAPSSTTAEDFLDRINSLVSNDLQTGRFITMAVAVVSETGSVDLLSAGHGPTFLFRAATSTVESFGGDGPPLGVLPGEPYTPTTRLTMNKGDALVLLTDGFMEYANPEGKQLGKARLQELVRTHGSKPPKDLIAALDRDVLAFGSGAPQEDDMTAVVLRRL